MNFSARKRGEEVRDALSNSLLPFYKTDIISRRHGSPRCSPPCNFLIKLLLRHGPITKKGGKQRGAKNARSRETVPGWRNKYARDGNKKDSTFPFSTQARLGGWQEVSFKDHLRARGDTIWQGTPRRPRGGDPLNFNVSSLRRIAL